MKKARILKIIERGMDGIAMFAIFQALVSAGWIEPGTNVIAYAVVAVIATVIAGIVSAEREAAESSK